MLKQKYFLTGIFILSAERQPIKLAWRKIVWLLDNEVHTNILWYTLSLRENKNIFDKEHNNNEYYVAPKMLSNNLKVVLSQLFIVPLPTK